jgi:hypothetical protein
LATNESSCLMFKGYVYCFGDHCHNNMCVIESLRSREHPKVPFLK